MKIFGAVLILFCLQSFAKEEVDLPKWLMEKIKAEGAPTSVSKMKVRSRTYYLVDAPCCDQYNYIYTEAGRKICAKDGGKDGRGDGNCEKFISKKDLQQTWQPVWRQGEQPKN